MKFDMNAMMSGYTHSPVKLDTAQQQDTYTYGHISTFSETVQSNAETPTHHQPTQTGLYNASSDYGAMPPQVDYNTQHLKTSGAAPKADMFTLTNNVGAQYGASLSYAQFGTLAPSTRPQAMPHRPLQ